jgi:hypothetical protein
MYACYGACACAMRAELTYVALSSTNATKSSKWRVSPLYSIGLLLLPAGNRKIVGYPCACKQKTHNQAYRCVCVCVCMHVCVCVCVSCVRARSAYRYNNGWIVVGRSIDLGHNNIGVLGKVLTHLLPRGRHLLTVATPYDTHTHTHTERERERVNICLLAHVQRLAKEMYRERRIR